MATEKYETVRATVIEHDPGWQEPVIPIVAGITGWSVVEDDGFTRWFARAGEVVLGMWTHDSGWPGRDEDEIVMAEAPAFEVVLSLDTHAAILADLPEAGRGTPAVLEFRGGEEEPPQWGSCEIGIEGLGDAMTRANELARTARGVSVSPQEPERARRTDMTERTVEKGYQDYEDCRRHRGEVERLWYPRGDTVVFGVWQHELDGEEGDREWSKDIPNWNLPMSPPHVELVFPLPVSEEALRSLLEQGSQVSGLRGALRRVTGR